MLYLHFEKTLKGHHYGRHPRSGRQCYNYVVPFYFVQISTDLVQIWTSKSSGVEELPVQK
jgi:hypothetical protein